MPIKSYLAIPKEGQKEILQKEISQLDNCEVTSSENKNVLVILTDAGSDKEDKELFKQLNGLENLQLLTLVSAFSN